MNTKQTLWIKAFLVFLSFPALSFLLVDSSEECFPPIFNFTTVISQVSQSSDDAEENDDGDMYLDSSDLELVKDGDNQHIGIRFQNITVPQGATIRSAYLEFEVDEDSDKDTKLEIRAEDVDNALTFTSTNDNITDRPVTANRVEWKINADWFENEVYQSPDISEVIEEVISRSGWVNGNALAIIIDGSGKKVVESYDGESAAAPKLVIEYEVVADPDGLFDECGCTGNELENGSYENSNTSNWNVDANVSVEYLSNLSFCGNVTPRIKRNTGTGVLNNAMWQQENAVTANDMYSLSFEAGVYNTSSNSKVYIRFYNSSNSLISQNYIDVNHDLNIHDQLLSYSLLAVAPAGSSYIQVAVEVDEYWMAIDNICFTSGICSAPTYEFQNPTLLTGTSGMVGSTYEFSNVYSGVDVIMTIESVSHSDIVVESIDEPAATNGGYDWAFQPIIDYNWANSNGSMDPAGDKSVTFRFDFVDASTGEAKSIPDLKMTAVDVDGDSKNIREFIEASGFIAYETQSPTELTLSGSLRALGPLNTYSGVVETALTTMISYDLSHTSSLRVTYGGNYSGASNTSDGAESRMNCLFFKCYDFNSSVACPSITISAPDEVCAGESATLTASTSGGQGTCSIQWQQSSNNITWSNIAGANSDFLNITPNTSTYYRATYACTGNTDCGTMFSLAANLLVDHECFEICDNGIDDDFDGLVDCDDPDCGSTVATASPDVAICSGAPTTISATASGGNDPYIFVWSNGLDSGDTKVVTPVSTTAYTVTVTNDNDCTSTDQVIVSVDTCGEDCTNGIDDDGDGLIDTFDPDCTDGDCTVVSGQNFITGTTFHDQNSDLNFNAGEMVGPNISVNLYQDVDKNGFVSAGDVLLQTDVTDNNGDYSFTVTPSFSASFSGSILDGCDDARHDNNGENKLELGKDKNIGIRFEGISIPAGATITSAYVYFTAKSDKSNIGNVDIYAEDSQNFDDFCTNEEVDTRVRTTAFTSWQVENWVSDTEYQSTDIKPVIQELVDSYGAYNNGEMAIILISNGANNVEAKSYETNDDGTDAPRLVINFTGNINAGYIVQIDETTLPVNKELTTVNEIPVTFSAFGQTVCNVNFGYNDLEICDNGVDDNGNGLIDCDDPSCSKGLSVTALGAATICGGSNNITAVVTGGTSPYSYTWSNSLGNLSSYSVSPSVTTVYGVTVTDANGCTETGQVTVTVDCSDPCANQNEDPYLSALPNPQELIPAGSFIVNMGVEPQTVNNALLPYGLVWELLDVEQVPVKWSINSNKAKDGSDFIYEGVEFKGGPFIILEEFRTPMVDAIIANWVSQGVVGVTTTSDFYAPIYRTINYSMNWTLDEENGSIAEGYLINAGIPDYAYNWVLPENLDCCHDVFVMPHAHPEWATHSYLLGWNDCIGNGGCEGAIWAGCKAVSELENIYNPADPGQKMNFLMMDPIAPAMNPAVWSGDHDDGSMNYQHNYHDHPVMQFMGSLDGAQEGGAEQVYLPTVGWRPNTIIGIEDIGHADIPSLSQGPAAKLAFGYAFSDPNRGFVTYEAAHDVAKSDSPENIAAQRAFLNFSFMAVYNKAIKPITVVPEIMVSNQSYNLDATATGGSGVYNYSWTSDCGGAIINGNTSNATFIAPMVSVSTTCLLHLTITDNCGTRTAFNTIEVVVDPQPEDCTNGIDDDGDGLIDGDDPDCCSGITLTTGGGATICSGVPTTISAAASGGNAPYTYTWSHGLGTGASHSVIPSITTTYMVTVTDNIGCSTTGQVVVTVNQAPVASAGTDLTICQNFSTILNASALGGTTPYSYIWSDGLGTDPNPIVTPLSTKTYSVTVTSANGCNDVAQVTITVELCVEDCSDAIDNDGDGLVDCDDPECGPSVDAGTDVNVCPGDAHFLLATGSGGNGALTYTWNNGHTGQSQSVSPAGTTTYTVTVTAPSGCTAVDQVTVNVVTCGEDCTNGIDDDGDGLVDCDDPDCVALAAPNLAADEYVTCPAMPYSERVTYNDDNLQNPVFSISSNPTNGSVTIDATGKFTYVPAGMDCGIDQFDYQVCNLATGCCSQATVTINMNDVTSPTLQNVPADITISCDDAVPTPPNVTAFDECPGIFVDFDENSDQHFVGACASYTITRTWTATDLCGNQSMETQQITIIDNTKPEIFQVYTLENGKRVIAGVSKNVTSDWKYVPFPTTFSETPMIFTTVVTNNEFSAVTVRQRNAYSEGFELRVIEEEANDGSHIGESVSWIAVEPGTNLGDLVLEAGRWQNVGSTATTRNFSGYFTNSPGLITAVQSTNDIEPSNIRLNTLTDGSVNLFVQEEQSSDAEMIHGLEHIGYLAFVPGIDLIDERKRTFGETGKMNLTNAWTTVSLSGNYTKPVVVFGSASNNDTDPVNVRVRNVTSNSFEVRVQEWDYLDGNHGTETVSWVVIEGSIPGNMEYYCSGSASHLKVGINVFAMDNCDNQTAFGYTETPSNTGNGTLTLRTWMAIDDCGNTSIITRYDTCSTAALSLKAILHGASLGSDTGLMRDDLRQEGLIPLEEPFSSLPAFPFVEDTTPNIDQTNNGNDADTVAMPTIPPAAAAATYRTIADGDWNDAATWQNGNVPPNNLNNESISVEHEVAMLSGSLYLKSTTTFWVTNGSLTLSNGLFHVGGGYAELNNSNITISQGFINAGPSSLVIINNCNLNIGLDFDNQSGARVLDNVCMNVGGDVINNSTLDTMRNVNITLGGNYTNGISAASYYENTKLRLTSGNFLNSISSTIEGAGLIIWLEAGGITNSGIWTAPIDQYCVAGSAINLGGILPIAEDCSGMPDYFSSCNSLIQPVIINEDPVQNVDAAFISKSGTLDPVLLSVDGNGAVVDWLLLEIRDPNTEEIVEYATVVLLKNGDIVSEDGETIINFPTVKEGDYLTSIRHRNHIALLLESPVNLSILNPPFIDFTDPAVAVRGGSVGGNESGGVRKMWGGDYNEDGQVIYQGPNNDVFYLFSRILSDGGNTDFLANYIVNVYDLHDFNLDGKVIYQGPNNDRASLLYHTVLSHANNVGFLANYIVKDFLP